MTANPSGNYGFGRFELQPDERRLLAEGAPVRVGRHAFDLLIALVERSGHLVTKDELFDRVWPKLVVEENTLQAHVSALRKILGPDAIATVSGRGYRFTLAVTACRTTPTSPSVPAQHNLPQQLTSFIGREKEVAELNALPAHDSVAHSHRLRRMRQDTPGDASGGGSGARIPGRDLARGVCAAGRPGPCAAEPWPTCSWSRSNPASVTQTLDRAPGRSVCSCCWTTPNTCSGRARNLRMPCAAMCPARHPGYQPGAPRHCGRIHLPGAVAVGSRPDARRHAGQIVARDRHVCSSSGLVCRGRTLRSLQRTPGAGVDLPSAGWHSAGHRACRPACTVDVARGAQPSTRPAVRPADRRLAYRLAAPTHVALADRLELRPAGQRRAALLDRLSVFAGGWTLEAAERVCAGTTIDAGEVLDLLTSLVDKSLVVADERDGATRYVLLETVRHYARDQLQASGEEAETQRRHLAGFIAIAEASEQSTMRFDQRSVHQLDPERDNVRAALSRTVAEGGDVAGGMRLAGAMSLFWSKRGDYAEGRAWFAALLAAARPDTDEGAMVRALRGAGRLAQGQNGLLRACRGAVLERPRDLSGLGKSCDCGPVPDWPRSARR